MTTTETAALRRPASGPVIIGLDVGTSSCKAVAFDLSGAAIGRARRPYVTRTSAEGAVTQHPADWLAAVTDALTELAGRIGSREVLGIGLSGQIGTHVLLDAQGASLGEAITWQDGRSAAVLDEIAARLDGAELARELQTWLPAGPTWPLPRLLWLSRSDATFAAARHIAQPKDLVCLHLTGRLVSDPSSWRGLARRDGSIAELALAALGLPNLLPELVPGGAVAGPLTSDLAARIGLPVATPVIVGWNDLNASLIGIGAVAPGDAFDIAGTSEHLGFVSNGPAPGLAFNSVPQHGVSTQQHTIYGVSSNGGGVVEWLRGVLPAAVGDAALATLVAGSPPGADRLLFLPYLRGERAPVWDAAAAGSYVGLRADHCTGALARAALEGVAFNLRQIREALPPHDRHQSIRATGGPARLAAWNTIKADVLQSPVTTMVETDSASLGAAMVAAIAVGAFTDVRGAAASMVHSQSITEPNSATSGLYDELYGLYAQLHPALADISHHLTSKDRHD
jgi:sugar (pentulose or hexulose) kinase